MATSVQKLNAEKQVVSPFSTPEAREVERRAKREAVLRAAVKMFNERGFYASSLDDVATSLGITKATIYHYLASKDQVLFECLTRGLEQLAAAAEHARGMPGTGLLRLKSFMQKWAEINMEDFGKCVVNTSDAMLSPESATRFRALKCDLDLELRGLVSEAMADGSITKGDVKLISFTLAGALNWPSRWYQKGGELSPSQVAERIVDILVSGISPKS